MPAKPLAIGDRCFPRQMDALSFFKDMLAKYKKGDVVDEVDQRDLMALLERHISKDEKIGDGVDFFRVDADLYGGKCFWLVRKDGSEDDFSYKRCVTGIWD